MTSRPSSFLFKTPSVGICFAIGTGTVAGEKSSLKNNNGNLTSVNGFEPPDSLVKDSMIKWFSSIPVEIPACSIPRSQTILIHFT
jgi:hypothetical protein